MALNANKQGGDNYTPQANIAPGSYPARLVQIIDLGLQAQKPFQGKEKAPVQEIMFTYELVDEFMKDDDGKDLEDKPRWISETMPFYGLFADKAKSTQRYNAFDPSGAYEGDLTKAIGIAVNVAVVNNAKGDKVYDNVGTVASMRPKDAEKCPEPKNPTKVFDLDTPDMEVFNKLPKWIQDKIKSNLNYNGSALQKALGESASKESKKEPEKIPEATEEENPY
jgi:hypothetical protein